MSTTTDVRRSGGLRTTHTMTQLLGLVLLDLMLVVTVWVSIVAFEGEYLGMIVTMLAVVGGVTVVVLRVDRTWANVLGIVAAVALGVVNVYGFFGVVLVLSPIEFGLGLLHTGGFFLAIGGGVAAIRARRRGHLGRSERESVFLRRTPLILIALVAASTVASLVTREKVSAADALGATAVDMADFEFAPVDVVVPSGGTVLVSNEDLFIHDFTVPDLDVELSLRAGGQAIVDLSDAPAGTYELICTLHEVDGMVGTLTVEG